MSERRRNHEGSITRRGDSVRIQFSVDGRRYSVTAPTEREAKRKMRERIRQVEGGTLPPRERLTVEQWLTRYLDDVARLETREMTYRTYKSLAQNHIIPALGRIRLEKLQAADVRRLYSDLQRSGLSPTSIRLIHAILRVALKVAVEDGLVSRTVMESVRPPRSRSTQMTALTPEQCRALLDAAGDAQMETLLRLALFTGMRQGELLGLRWQDVDMERGVVSVVQQLSRDGTFTEPKTARGRRRIDLRDRVMASLRAQRARQAEMRLRCGPSWADSGLVFTTPFGMPLTPWGVGRYFKHLLRDADLPDVRFHDLRHTAASLMLSLNVHPKEVQEKLGHSSIAMTMDRYSHIMPGMGILSAEALDELLG